MTECEFTNKYLRVTNKMLKKGYESHLHEQENFNKMKKLNAPATQNVFRTFSERV